MLVDLPLEQLETYRSSQTRPADFTEFWAETLAQSRAAAWEPRVKQVDTPLRHIEVYDVTFAGFDGEPVRAWLRLPAVREGALPAVVEYVGYGGGRGFAVDNLGFAAAGYAHFHMDTRGQGSGWSPGDTPDAGGTGPQHPGMMTRGIDSPETYYYRRLMTDAVLAVDAVRELPQVDGSRVAVSGGSQGGGLALAAGGLLPDLSAVFAAVPFLCDFPRATRVTDNAPYVEIAKYLTVHRTKVAQVHQTLSYFDCVNLVSSAKAPVWMSAALMDATCPPSTVFAAYNAYAGPKDIAVWEYNGHEGGGTLDLLRALNTLAELWK